MVVPLAWSRALEIVKLDSPCDVDHAGLVLAAGEVAGFLGGPRGLARSGAGGGRRKKCGSRGAYDFLWREAPHPEQVFIYRDSGSIEVGFCCKTMLDTVSNRNFHELCDAVARAMDWDTSRTYKISAK